MALVRTTGYMDHLEERHKQHCGTGQNNWLHGPLRRETQTTLWYWPEQLVTWTT